MAGEEGFARLRAGRVAALGLLRLAVPEESFGLTLFLRFFDPKLNKEVYYTSMEEKQSWGRPSAARMSF